MKPTVVVVGSLNMDFVVSVERLPAPGETVLGSEFQMNPGGKGANQACAVGRLGADSVRACMIGRVGCDVFGDHLKASLAASGVDMSGVLAIGTHSTGVAFICVEESGQNSIVVAPGANGALAATDVEAMGQDFRGAKFVLFQLESPLATVAAALELARHEGARTILDPAPAQALSRKILSSADILTPNESEACLLLGLPLVRLTREDAQPVAQALREHGARSVILKLGEQGCFYSDGEAAIYSPGFPVAVKDTTAAGDTFNAGLAVALAEGQSMTDALYFANAAACISVTRAGAQASVPSRAEVDEFLSLRR